MILFFSDHTVFIVFPDHSMEYFVLCQKKISFNKSRACNRTTGIILFNIIEGVNKIRISIDENTGRNTITFSNQSCFPPYTRSPGTKNYSFRKSRNLHRDSLSKPIRFYSDIQPPRNLFFFTTLTLNPR